MDIELKKHRAHHVLALPYPSQGHINPMHQFCKRLVSKGLKSTLAITNFIFKTNSPKSSTVQIDTISDGFDEGGFMQADSIQDYLAKLESAGRISLAQIIEKYQKANQPVGCLVYDSFLPWALDVAKEYGIITASFYTQPCAVNLVYYYVHHGLLELPVPSFPVAIPGLPLLDRLDMPSFIAFENSYPAYFRLVLNQFSNNEKADMQLVNTFYLLEKELMERNLPRLRYHSLTRRKAGQATGQGLPQRKSRCSGADPLASPRPKSYEEALSGNIEPSTSQPV